jgi:dTMP kinase
MRGLFIVFEGLDRSGKSSQAKLLSEHLSSLGKQTKLIRFPARDSGPIGSILDSYLANKSQSCDEAIHLLFSANRWELRNQIISDLDQGITVICDRYLFSGVVYSATKGLDVAWCKGPDAGLPAPDLVIFLGVSPEVARLRGDFGAERYEQVEFQAGVRRNFQHFFSLPYWRQVDADRDFAEVSHAINSLVLPYFATEPKPLGLWRGEPSL